MPAQYKNPTANGGGWELVSSARVERLIKLCHLTAYHACMRNTKGFSRTRARNLGRCLDGLEEAINEIQTVRRKHAAARGDGIRRREVWSPDDIKKEA